MGCTASIVAVPRYTGGSMMSMNSQVRSVTPISFQRSSSIPHQAIRTNIHLQSQNLQQNPSLSPQLTKIVTPPKSLYNIQRVLAPIANNNHQLGSGGLPIQSKLLNTTPNKNNVKKEVVTSTINGVETVQVITTETFTKPSIPA